MKNFVVNINENGKKLNTVILARFPELSFSNLQKALRKKDVKINGKRVHENLILQEGDDVSIYLPDSCFEKSFPYTLSSLTIYEDDNILVLNKPSGIEVQGDNSFTSWIKSQYQNTSSFPEPCHRLDRNTSGLILYAKNKPSLDILLDCFKMHEIEKHYLATVYGIPLTEQDKLIAYLFKDSKKSTVIISDTPKKGYQKIITLYKILKKDTKNNTSVLDVTLETGRTHQIRAQLAHIGYPILGDGKYGKNEINKKFSFNSQQLVSYSLQFHFKSDKKFLNYLNNKKFILKKDGGN